MCCDSWGATPSDGEEGVCPDCGSLTYDGCSEEVCGYSPELCETCGFAPCDQSC